VLKPVRDALRAWSPATGAENALGAAAAAWPEVVGAEVARHSRPLQVTGETLVIGTRSSAWSEQLSFLADRILATLRNRFGLKGVKRLRFRVGTMRDRAQTRVIRGSVQARRTAASLQERALSLEETLARFRAGVQRARRAKTAQGSKECVRCASLIAPDRTLCAACANRVAQERERLVSRLLFDVPWLGYTGIAALVEGLQREEYEAIRLRLLSRWWTILDRARKAQRLSRDRRERLVASSYVIVKSGLEPEHIAPATLRNLLGDELTELLKNHDSE
jgi:hypothetical protein